MQRADDITIAVLVRVTLHDSAQPMKSPARRFLAGDNFGNEIAFQLTNHTVTYRPSPSRCRRCLVLL